MQLNQQGSKPIESANDVHYVPLTEVQHHLGIKGQKTLRNGTS